MTSKDYAREYLSKLRKALEDNDEHTAETCVQYIFETGDPYTIIEMQNLLNEFDND